MDEYRESVGDHFDFITSPLTIDEKIPTHPPSRPSGGTGYYEDSLRYAQYGVPAMMHCRVPNPYIQDSIEKSQRHHPLRVNPIQERADQMAKTSCLPGLSGKSCPSAMNQVVRVVPQDAMCPVDRISAVCDRCKKKANDGGVNEHDDSDYDSDDGGSERRHRRAEWGGSASRARSKTEQRRMHGGKGRGNSRHQGRNKGGNDNAESFSNSIVVGGMEIDPVILLFAFLFAVVVYAASGIYKAIAEIREQLEKCVKKEG